SRRRHTILVSDWSSDVCSSDLVSGFLTRLWATAHFYTHHMRVISLEPQSALITSGPFRWSRNPLYLGGNVFTFFGASLLLGSPEIGRASLGKEGGWRSRREQER